MKTKPITLFLLLLLIAGISFAQRSQPYHHGFIEMIVAPNCTTSCDSTSSIVTASIDKGDSTIFCPEDSVVLDAQDPEIDAYCWSNGETSSSITVRQAGNFVLVVYDSIGCTDTTSIVVEIHEVNWIYPRDTFKCTGDPFVLDAYDPAVDTYIWSTGSTDSAITVNSADTYIVNREDSSNGCEYSDTVNVTINQGVSTNLGPDTIICADTSVLLDAGTDAVSYMWNTGDTTQTIIADSTDNYYVRVSHPDGCTDSDTVNVTVNPLPSKPAIIADFTSLSTQNYDTYQWYYQGNPIAGATDQSLEITQSGEYSVLVGNNLGCTISSGDTLITLGLSSEDVPKGFSPNGDGINDNWVIWGIQTFAGNTVTVFNRYGTKVFEASDYDNTWSGVSDNGQELPASTYYYTIDLNDGSEEIGGFVIITR